MKSRSLAAALVTGGHVRVNSDRASKASYGVQVGDVLTFPQGDRIRVVRILAPAKRRGRSRPELEDFAPDPQARDRVESPRRRS